MPIVFIPQYGSNAYLSYAFCLIILTTSATNLECLEVDSDRSAKARFKYTLSFIFLVSVLI